MRLEERSIVVTGAGSGLGKSMARGFVEEGARVTCADVDGDRLAAAIADIETGAGEAIDVVADVRSWDDVRRLVDAATAAYDDIDVLVNNVGIRQWHVTEEPGRPVVDLPAEAWEAVIETNLHGTFNCTRAVLPGMLASGTGRIVHLSSAQGTRGVPRKAAYVTSKFGIEGFHETLALELEGTGVSSIAFRPGAPFDTAIKRELGVGRSTVEDTDEIVEPAVAIAAGAGENGDRFRRTEDGDLADYSRAG